MATQVLLVLVEHKSTTSVPLVLLLHVLSHRSITEQHHTLYVLQIFRDWDSKPLQSDFLHWELALWGMVRVFKDPHMHPRSRPDSCSNGNTLQYHLHFEGFQLTRRSNSTLVPRHPSYITSCEQGNFTPKRQCEAIRFPPSSDYCTC